MAITIKLKRASETANPRHYEKYAWMLKATPKQKQIIKQLQEGIASESEPEASALFIDVVKVPRIYAPSFYQFMLGAMHEWSYNALSIDADVRVMLFSLLGVWPREQHLDLFRNMSEDRLYLTKEAVQVRYEDSVEIAKRFGVPREFIPTPNNPKYPDVISLNDLETHCLRVVFGYSSVLEAPLKALTYYAEGLSYREIGSLTGFSHGIIDKHLERGTAQLMSWLYNISKHICPDYELVDELMLNQALGESVATLVRAAMVYDQRKAIEATDPGWGKYNEDIKVWFKRVKDEAKFVEILGATKLFYETNENAIYDPHLSAEALENADFGGRDIEAGLQVIQRELPSLSEKQAILNVLLAEFPSGIDIGNDESVKRLWQQISKIKNEELDAPYDQDGFRKKIYKYTVMVGDGRNGHPDMLSASRDKIPYVQSYLEKNKEPQVAYGVIYRDLKHLLQGDPVITNEHALHGLITLMYWENILPDNYAIRRDYVYRTDVEKQKATADERYKEIAAYLLSAGKPRTIQEILQANTKWTKPLVRRAAERPNVIPEVIRFGSDGLFNVNVLDQYPWLQIEALQLIDQYESENETKEIVSADIYAFFKEHGAHVLKEPTIERLNRKGVVVSEPLVNNKSRLFGVLRYWARSTHDAEWATLYRK